MPDHQEYVNPLSSRYASKEMLYNFSPDKKFKTWRKLWVILAQAQKELGLSAITQEQIEELQKFQDDLNLETAQEYEKKLKHDVMAHIYAYGDQAIKARKIIHLGATSAYVGDNTDLIQIKDGLAFLKQKMLVIIKQLSDFALEYKNLPTLGFTHFQAAQLTTVGKRACLWLSSLVADFKDLEYRLENLAFLGLKGTTGTQASFKELFNEDFSKVKQLDNLVTHKAGFKIKQSVSGQTYDRKTDSKILDLLSSIAQSAHKFTNDIRLLAHLKEIEEPFSKDQIGSSAMPYKRNPIWSERTASLAKFVISLCANGSMVASTQWFERTLDDSANRRLSIPQAFLGVDAILILWQNILNGLVVYPKVIQKHIEQELPFIATENIMMAAVKNGKDRQEVHEIIRELSMQESRAIKQEGKENHLLERIITDGRLGLDQKQLDSILDARHFIGFAPQQVEDFIQTEIEPLLKAYTADILLSPINTINI